MLDDGGPCRSETAVVLLWQNLVEEVLGLAFLLQVSLRALLHQVLQVVGVLLHPGQQVVEDAGAALPGGTQDTLAW